MEAALASSNSCPPNAAFISLFVIWALQFSFGGLLLRRLKQRHAEIWNELGSPTLFWNNSIRNGFLVSGFIIRRRYARLRDRTLALLGDIVLVLSLVLLTIFIFGWVGAIPPCGPVFGT